MSETNSGSGLIDLLADNLRDEFVEAITEALESDLETIATLRSQLAEAERRAIQPGDVVLRNSGVHRQPKRGEFVGNKSGSVVAQCDSNDWHGNWWIYTRTPTPAAPEAESEPRIHEYGNGPVIKQKPFLQPLMDEAAKRVIEKAEAESQLPISNQDSQNWDESSNSSETPNSSQEESRTVPPVPVLLPAEPPKNPDGPATPEPQAAEGPKWSLCRVDTSDKLVRILGPLSANDKWLGGEEIIFDVAHDNVLLAHEILAYFQGTSPLHVENSRLAAQVKELQNEAKRREDRIDGENRFLVAMREALRLLPKMNDDFVAMLSRLLAEVRKPAAPSSTAAESGEWEAAIEKWFGLDEEGTLRVRSNGDYQPRACEDDIREFIREHVAPSPKPAVAGKTIIDAAVEAAAMCGVELSRPAAAVEERIVPPLDVSHLNREYEESAEAAAVEGTGEACRRCVECAGMSHHWMPDMRDPEDDDDFEPGDYGCKHCDERGHECSSCDGNGCEQCHQEGVIPLTEQDYGEEMNRWAMERRKAAPTPAAPAETPLNPIGIIRQKLEAIVCTEGCDRGVILLSSDGPTHTELVNGKKVQVYDHENFSPLGDALIELHDLTTIQDAWNFAHSLQIEGRIRELAALHRRRNSSNPHPDGPLPELLEFVLKADYQHVLRHLQRLVKACGIEVTEGGHNHDNAFDIVASIQAAWEKRAAPAAPAETGEKWKAAYFAHDIHYQWGLICEGNIPKSEAEAAAAKLADYDRMASEVQAVREILKPYQDNPDPGAIFTTPIPMPGSLASEVELEIRRYARYFKESNDHLAAEVSRLKGELEAKSEAAYNAGLKARDVYESVKEALDDSGRGTGKYSAPDPSPGDQLKWDCECVSSENEFWIGLTDNFVTERVAQRAVAILNEHYAVEPEPLSAALRKPEGGGA